VAVRRPVLRAAATRCPSSSGSGASPPNLGQSGGDSQRREDHVVGGGSTRSGVCSLPR
jgi:hypothetical protein